MEDANKKHWESIYTNKKSHDLSWTEAKPEVSLNLIAACNINKSDAIIDVGGGESTLVDFLLAEGYTNITVLDISEKALEQTKARLGEKANSVNWIVSDILEFVPEQKYVLWHDRAVFHFLTTESDQLQYIDLVYKSIKQHLIVGTFALTGPEKCSGLPVCRNSAESLNQLFQGQFSLVEYIAYTHTTPFNTQQDFIFGRFEVKN